MVYVVSLVGCTGCEPEGATLPMLLSRLAVVALLEVQVRVTVSPASTELLSDEIETVGGGDVGVGGFFAGFDTEFPEGPDPPPQPITTESEISRTKCQVSARVTQGLAIMPDLEGNFVS
jgi:hypothetical protein